MIEYDLLGTKEESRMTSVFHICLVSGTSTSDEE